MVKYSLSIMYLTLLGVILMSVNIANSYNPYGGTGCHTSVSWTDTKSDGICWRYCTSAGDEWCYTGQDCTAKICYQQNVCSGAKCPPNQPKCVENCAGPDPHCDSKERTVIACEGKDAVLDCRVSGKSVNIISANYGRTEPGDKVCPHQSIKTTNCLSPDSKKKAILMCKNKQNCELKASNEIFGDPCVNTYKYLQVEYSCV